MLLHETIPSAQSNWQITQPVNHAATSQFIYREIKNQRRKEKLFALCVYHCDAGQAETRTLRGEGMEGRVCVSIYGIEGGVIHTFEESSLCSPAGRSCIKAQHSRGNIRAATFGALLC